MIIEETSAHSGAAHGEEHARLRKAGEQSAKAHRVFEGKPARPWTRNKQLAQSIAQLHARRDLPEEDRTWLRENQRLTRTALREVRDLHLEFRDERHLQTGDSDPQPVPTAIAADFLDAAMNRFTESGLEAFLAGFQTHTELEMGELWALKPGLQFAILDRLVAGHDVATLLTSLRYVGQSQWRDLFESVSLVDHTLREAPGSEYGDMDPESRDLYRTAISAIAKNAPASELAIAREAIRLASTATGRRGCVGYYLLDNNGVRQLRATVGYKAPLWLAIRDVVLRYPNGFYLIGIELMTLAIVYTLLSPLDNLTPIVAGFFLLLLPATQAAVDFMNNLVSSVLRPRVLPKLDFSKGIPENCATMVAVPTLLLNEQQVHELTLDLEIRYLANRDPNLCFALVTDSPDSDKPFDERDRLVDVCSELIDGLNKRYGTGERTPFYMFHRHRIYNPSEGRWMGWERKRGKLLDLNQYLRGGFDSFPVKIGNLNVLPGIKYVITLDSDTQLPRDSAAKLIGAMAHPLNRAVIDPQTSMVVEGYGILQPRIGVSIQSSSRSRLASIYSGQTGFDIYTRAISDVYQDLFGEGIFTGKGIYDVDALEAALHNRFPENALLSHDLIEGSYARAGLVSDIELIDDYPSHFSAYSRRKHRWVRGDWQIMRWLLPQVPNFQRKLVPNPINLISRWKILDNLRRSLFEPATLALFIAGWFYLPGNVWHWTGASVAMWFMPVWAGLLFSILRAPVGTPAMRAWAVDLWKAAINGHLMAALGVTFLLHQALLSLDAIARSVLRVFFTRRKLLEWETAAESEKADRRKSTVDIYLEWTPWIAAVLGVGLWLVRPSSMPAALTILVLWFASRGISDFLNRAPRKANRQLRDSDVELLEESASRILRFFDDWSTESNHYLIPDNLREDGAEAKRLSPTNVGLLLNARIVGYLTKHDTLDSFIAKTRRTLDTLIALPKYNGHLLNWYDTDTLQPVEPLFVSTVDSGNLVACLWTLKQAVLSIAADHPSHGEQLRRIADDSESLASAMDFSFLYLPRRKVLSVGFDTTTGQLQDSAYDLLASESRIASFVAIAKGDIAQEAWFHLGRRHTLARGERVLVSWTGTMFEYLMPALWMRHYPGTILHDTLAAMVRVQRDFARRKGVPWGISESACIGPVECEYGYQAFGIPDLSMKEQSSETLVISPYSTFLALAVDPQAAVSNLRRMSEFGWQGKYGFYEAVDYSHAGGSVMRWWMAHHHGMSLLAIANTILDCPMQRFFHAEPRVLATELLLHERVPSTVIVDQADMATAAA